MSKNSLYDEIYTFNSKSKRLKTFLINLNFNYVLKDKFMYDDNLHFMDPFFNIILSRHFAYILRFINFLCIIYKI